ncbi:hypothetical protein [Pelagibius sp. Alg239-R121]|uniref:hypothetical protein n=1 Tax=Pelagibius sp. Alg239-R121 TaxID=2993448 RepID=UPI0024A64DAF|nr:hypothetical protein [Pelagibius sp. Alg239-R121]
MAKPNKKGRSDYQSFVRIDRYLINSEAYRSLSPCARALHIEIKHRFNGRNNGEIALSVRGAADRVGVSVPTVCRAFSELESKGFLRATLKGSFNTKLPHATLWALTEEPAGAALATKEFMRWTAPKFKTRCKILSPLVQRSFTAAELNTAQKAPTVQRAFTASRNSADHGEKSFHTFIIPGGGVSKSPVRTVELTPKPVGAKIRQNFFMHHVRRHLEGALL